MPKSGGLLDPLIFMVALAVVAGVLSAILSGVSHELRTPLTRILSYAETLHESSSQDPETREFLNVILNNTKQLSGLVDEALHFAELIG